MCEMLVYSAVAFEYQEIREIIFGVLEAAYGIGFAAGPLIGQLLYSKYGFQECFYYLSYMLMIPLLLIWFLKFTRKDIP
jgi:predicted MFS family arabinose efflux permease